MGLRAGYLLLFVMVVIYTRANARNHATIDTSAMPMDHQVPSIIEDSKEIAASEQVCELCQSYTAQFAEYFKKKETQSKIISTLHKACSFLEPIKVKCVLLVDQYAALFFVKIALLQPSLFCKTVRLCGNAASVRLQNSDDACRLCHNVVEEILSNLQDPDKQLKIIKTLLDGCNGMDNFEQECKKLVFEYGPIMLANAEKFFDTIDVCAATQVCKADRPTTALLKKHSFLLLESYKLDLYIWV